MREIREAQAELEAALEAGDSDGIRRAARRLLDRTTEFGALRGWLHHSGRLIDLGLQAASMIHELRQPLSGIKAFAQLIESGSDCSPAIAEKAAAIVRHAGTMDAICGRLRAYARGEPQTRRPGDVNAAVEAALEMLRFELRRTAIGVDTVLAPGLPLVTADPIELQQILVNVIRNARDALAGRTGRVRIVTAFSDGHVEATVADDGPGVPSDVRARIFNPFVTHREGGVGLGLYLSRRIAEQAGGTLELVTSDVGATFRLRVPTDATP
jgi:two-component system NtrC family sensor kinase